MLAAMPLVSSLGLGYAKEVKVITSLVLGLNGNAVTVSEKVTQRNFTRKQSWRCNVALGCLSVAATGNVRKKQNRPKLRFATVFPYNCHYYQLRDWVNSSNLSEADLHMVVVPPVNMVAFLQSGEVDSCCVGGPWNAKAVRAGIGLTALTSFDIWQDSPEKLLGMLASI